MNYAQGTAGGVDGGSAWRRRAQPLLGTIVEVGVRCDGETGEDVGAAFAAAFAQVEHVQRCLSRFEADSDVGRFHALRRGQRLVMRTPMREVVHAARELRDASGAVFDISTQTSPHGWDCDGATLHKLDDAVRLDLGGIGKGYAVDCAVQALLDAGCAAGWVNAGGDLRSFGDIDVPVRLRDEAAGGVRPFASLRDGAFATSRLGSAHVSVAAPCCLWADALTKIVAGSGDAAHPLLGRYDAAAWIH